MRARATSMSPAFAIARRMGSRTSSGNASIFRLMISLRKNLSVSGLANAAPPRRIGVLQQHVVHLRLRWRCWRRLRAVELREPLDSREALAERRRPELGRRPAKRAHAESL